MQMVLHMHLLRLVPQCCEFVYYISCC